jgi:hypothetical protein
VQGPDIETPDEDYISTDPQSLATAVDTVLGAYDAQRGQGSMVGQTADLMHPEVIVKLRALKEQLHQWSML